MRIVFMGTPEFAVPTLDLIYRSGYEVVGVITSTDKMLGRGKKTVAYSPVKEYALSKHLKVLQPKNLKAAEFVEELRALNADLQVVVAFRMLPEVVWNMPPLGSLNLHGSLLPAFRGAAPINWAIINGARITGLTTFKLKHEIDTGTTIFQESVVIRPYETAGDIHDRLMHLGPPLMIKTIQAIESGSVEFKTQDESKVTHAPKIYHDKCEIDFSLDTESIMNFIHGMSPYPAAWMMFDGIKLKILRVKPAGSFDEKAETGHLHLLGKNNCILRTKDGALDIVEIQPAGRPRMNGRSFANGYLKRGE